MIIETEDYTTWITEKGTENGISFSDYENTDGRKWRIYGVCNACGMCEDGVESHVNIRYNPHTQERETYTRYFIWNDEPGVAGACSEIDFEKRKDIPMTPDGVNTIEECTLSGVWIE